MLRSPWLIGVLLIPLVAAVVGGMYWMRAKAVATYGTTEALDEWNQWRDAAADQAAKGGPVERKVPQSAEPPALVLMRDHFVACLGAAVVAATGCFLVFILLLRGVLTTPAPKLHDQ